MSTFYKLLVHSIDKSYVCKRRLGLQRVAERLRGFQEVSGGTRRSYERSRVSQGVLDGLNGISGDVTVVLGILREDLGNLRGLSGGFMGV